MSKNRWAFLSFGGKECPDWLIWAIKRLILGFVSPTDVFSATDNGKDVLEYQKGSDFSPAFFD